MEIVGLENLNFKDNSKDILKNITLSIVRGECVSIIGESGSGKSTLLKICSDLLSPSSGSIFFEKKEYKYYDPIDLRKKISYCIQIPQLFGKTVKDNLIFPFLIRKEKVDMDKIINLLEKVNLNEEYLQKDIYSLSGGEKQRVALIRNIIYKPEVLLLDEVTSALDSKTTKIIEGIIKEMNKDGVTIIWITHSLEQSSSIFKRRITMDNGKIIKEESF